MPSRKTSSASEDLRICFDRVIPDYYHPARAAAERASVENMNRLGVPGAPVGVVPAGGAAEALPPIDILLDAPPVLRAALPTIKKWATGATLRCRFLDGDATQRRKVESRAHQWEEHANITFRFVAKGDADIRISFGADSGSWSALGTDALVERYFPRYQPTMNFGWLRSNTEDTEYDRVVLHEFGHALGLIHEHQNPRAQLQWNVREVYRIYQGPPNFWSKEEIDHNILQRYSPNGFQLTRFDPDSIMLYMFPGSLFKDGKATPRNVKLSELDKLFMSQVYSR